MFMRGIEVEEVAADENVFGIWCFEDRDAARTQHAQHFVEQGDQRIDRNVLDDVKARDRADTGVGEAAQVTDDVVVDDVESSFATLRDRHSVPFHTTRCDTGFIQDFEPLATAGTEIDHIRIRHCLYVRQIDPETLFDLFACATEPILERGVELVELETFGGGAMETGIQQSDLNTDFFNLVLDQFSLSGNPLFNSRFYLLRFRRMFRELSFE